MPARWPGLPSRCPSAPSAATWSAWLRGSDSPQRSRRRSVSRRSTARTPWSPPLAEPGCSPCCSGCPACSPWLAAVVLVAVALRTLQVALRRYRSAARGSPPLHPQLGPFRAYLTLIGMTAINPATVITFAAVVLGRSADAGPTGTGGRAVRHRRPGGLRGLAAAAGRRRLGSRPAAPRTARSARHRARFGRHHARSRRRGAGPLSCHGQSPSSCSVAASSTQVARPSIASVTSSGEGKLGAIRMLRSRGSLP